MEEAIDLQVWCQKNGIQIVDSKDIFFEIIGSNQIFYFLPLRESLFNKHSFFNLTEDEYADIDNFKEKEKLNFVFQFGEMLYYCPCKTKKDENNEQQYVINLIEFLYIGESSKNHPSANVGIHTEYELLNSALNYKSAIKKAKFLGLKYLGICDKNTLGASLPFQLECKKNNITPIVGTTVSVAYNYDTSKTNQVLHDVKLYMTSEKCWFNLLKINNTINIKYNGKFIPEEELLECAEDLVCVFDYSNNVLMHTDDKKKLVRIVEKYKSKFKKIYYQFSSVEYSSSVFDLSCLNGFKVFYNELMSDDFKPVYIDDVYYLEQENNDCKVTVNEIAKTVHQHSYEQYFKTIDVVLNKITGLFKTENEASLLFDIAVETLKELCGICSFEIPVSGAKIPRYEIDNEMLTDEESVVLLRKLCEEGFTTRVESKIKDVELLKVYRERLEREFKVITEAGYADYFLIIIDTVNYVIKQGHMIGTGRGSVGGSLVAYCTGIIRIDPIENNLLFERFLNEARLTPDKFYILKLSDGTKLEVKEGGKVKTKDGEKLVQDITIKDEVVC